MKDLINKNREQKLIKYLENNLRQYLTKEEWEEMLPKYVENYMKWYPTRNEEIFDNPHNPDTIIGGGFTWENTPEPNYWSQIWNKVSYRNNGTFLF